MAKIFRKFLVLYYIVCFATVSLFPGAALAVSSGEFVNNKIYYNLISNRDFTNFNSWSVNAIQGFLNATPYGTRSPLADYSEGGRSAAQIIYDAAHGRKFTNPPNDTFLNQDRNGIVLNESTGTINPQLILVYLQKEQSLVSGPNNMDYALKHAMGYGCPDTAPCDPSFYGFTSQVEWGAWQLRYAYERAAQGKGYSYFIGAPYETLDGYTVLPANAATASVYRYTPHVFDSAYNFYNMYLGWFGANPDSPSNDMINYTLKTYETSMTISGGKTAVSIAYLDGSAIVGAGLHTLSWNINLQNLTYGTNNYTITYKDENGGLVGEKQIIISVQKPGDVNGDATVGIQDLSIFASYWGQDNPEEPLADLNNDHAVDIQDLSILAGYWGT